MTQLFEQHTFMADCPFSCLEGRLPTRTFKALKRHFEEQGLVHPAVGYVAELHRRGGLQDVRSLGLGGIQRITEVLEAGRLLASGDGPGHDH